MRNYEAEKLKKIIKAKEEAMVIQVAETDELRKELTKLKSSLLYSRDEVYAICESAYRFGFSGGEAEYTCSSPSKLHNCKSFQVWFNQRNKKEKPDV